MSDDRVRALEREVDASHDVGPSDARHQLTKERLRSLRGVVAWWPGPEAPHPSAARVKLTFSGKHPVTGEAYSKSAGGWALAASSVDDVFMLAQAARAATLLDLASGNWVRCNGRRSAVDIHQLKTQEEVTTVDAFGRPRPTIRAQNRGIDQTRVIAHGGSYSAIWREEPIFDTEWLPEDGWTQTPFFQNFYTFCQTGAPRNKEWGVDSNLTGSGGPLPQAHVFEATGITLETSKPVDLDGFFLEWRITQALLIGIPATLAYAPSADGEGFEIPYPAPPVYPLAFPYQLQSLEQFSFRLTRPYGSRVGGFFCKVIVSGFMARGVFG